MHRFNEYIKTLEGSRKGDIKIPIGGYNPMAKDEAIAKLRDLKQLNAEDIIENILPAINTGLPDEERIVKLSVTLADDVAGGWTNRYTTDYQSRFKTSAMMKRNFCTPYFWTSEKYNKDLIEKRTQAACRRFIYQLMQTKPITLKEHVEQELYVQQAMGFEEILPAAVWEFYRANKDSTDLSLIMNFLYGDDVATSLGYTSLGIGNATITLL